MATGTQAANLETRIRADYIPISFLSISLEFNPRSINVLYLSPVPRNQTGLISFIERWTNSCTPGYTSGHGIMICAARASQNLCCQCASENQSSQIPRSKLATSGFRVRSPSTRTCVVLRAELHADMRNYLYFKLKYYSCNLIATIQLKYSPRQSVPTNTSK